MNETSDMAQRLDKLLADGHAGMGEPISKRLSRIEETLHYIVTKLGSDSKGWTEAQLRRFTQIETLMREMFEDEPLPPC